MIGMSDSARMMRHHLCAVQPGMARSSSTTSTGSARNRRSASSPSYAATMRWPALPRTAPSAPTQAGSSSTTSSVRAS